MLLSLVFVVAAVTKLRDPLGSRRAVTDFGVPVVLAAPLGVFLPLAELAVAVALIPTATAWWGAVGALALLLLFVVGIAINLARGRKPDCHCFGQLHSAPVGWKTLLRNGVLAAVAGFVVWQGKNEAGPSVVSWLGALSAAQLAALVGGLLVLGLLAAQWWFLIHVLRQNGRLLVRLEALESRLAAGGGVASAQNGAQQAAGLPVGTQAPAFSLLGLYGETLTLESLLAPDKPLMLIFTDPNCGPCTALLPEIGRWQREYTEKLTISLISRGTAEENRAKSSEHGLTNVLLQEDWEVGQAYQANGTPSAVFVQPDGTIGTPVVSSAEFIRALVAQVVGISTQQPMLGEPAPEIKRTDLKGKDIDLADFRGEETLVLFWNPGCGFCQQMLADLKEWEANPPEGAPRLLVVSAGSEEDNKAMGLTSPVVLDQSFTVGRAYGAVGTPSAVLVDAEGKVASEVVVGVEGVLELAGASRTEP